MNRCINVLLALLALASMGGCGIATLNSPLGMVRFSSDLALTDSGARETLHKDGVWAGISYQSGVNRTNDFIAQKKDQLKRDAYWGAYNRAYESTNYDGGAGTTRTINCSRAYPNKLMSEERRGCRDGRLRAQADKVPSQVYDYAQQMERAYAGQGAASAFGLTRPSR